MFEGNKTKAPTINDASNAMNLFLFLLIDIDPASKEIELNKNVPKQSKKVIGCMMLDINKTTNVLNHLFSIEKYKKQIVNKIEKERGNPPEILILNVDIEIKNKTASNDDIFADVILYINLNIEYAE